ncbi:MAG: hypothetical protein PHD29_07020 [bacterium]|nr:hypothetical protein [bacterium]MDD5354792.1 hypothetical protein [bacterium]MDD5756816.1 hypothetical protein [bacterium]
MAQEAYSLRERKHAKTKLALMRAFIERLKTQRFEEISISELCADLDVAEGTFFNYFPRKIDVIRYFTDLSSIHVIWQTEQRMNKKTYLDKIDNIFYYLGEEIENNTNLIYEIIAASIGQKQAMEQMTKITKAEKHFAFPGCAGIEDIRPPSMLFEGYFEEVIKKAVKSEELPQAVNIRTTVLFLNMLMAGLPLAIKKDKLKNIRSINREMLELLWKALGRKYDRGNQ